MLPACYPASEPPGPPGWAFSKLLFSLRKMVLRERIELSTSPLPMECSTTELPQLVAERGLLLPQGGDERKRGEEGNRRPNDGLKQLGCETEIRGRNGLDRPKSGFYKRPTLQGSFAGFGGNLVAAKAPR